MLSIMNICLCDHDLKKIKTTLKYIMIFKKNVVAGLHF